MNLSYFIKTVLLLSVFAFFLVKSIKNKNCLLIKKNTLITSSLRIALALLICFSVYSDLNNKNSYIMELYRSYLKKADFSHVVAKKNYIGTYANLILTFEGAFITFPKTKEDSKLVLSKSKAYYNNLSLKGVFKSKPDIILILNESTFNPKYLEMGLSLPQYSIFNTNKVMTSLLNVHTFGGGTWISQFNALTGIDISKFSQTIQMNPFTLLYKFKKSLPMILKDLNYKSSAILGTDKKYLSNDRNLKRYGFDTILGTDDFSNTEWSIRDRIIFQKAKEVLENNTVKPQFVYIETMHNHGPHGKNFAKDKANCIRENDQEVCTQLNDYLERLEATSKDSEILLEYAREGKKETLVIFFGDHLPAFDGQIDKLKFQDDINRFVTFYSIFPRSQEERLISPKQLDITFLPGLILDLAGLNKEFYYQTNSYIRHLCQGKAWCGKHPKVEDSFLNLIVKEVE